MVVRDMFATAMRTDNFNATEIVQPPPPRKLYFPYVDLARAGAVTLVLFFHIIVVLEWVSFPESGFLSIFRLGWIGVDLFFVISGFVITLSLGRNVDNFGRHGYMKPYFKNRLARIVPLYYLTSLCFIMVSVWQWSGEPLHKVVINILSHAFFVHSLSHVYAGALNGPAWSIGVEMQFYVFMALLFKWLPVHRPFLVCFTFMAVALAWRAGVWYTFNTSLNILILVSRVQQLPAVLDAFGLGCAIALIVRNHGHWLHKYLQTSWNNAAAWFIIAVIFSTVSWKMLVVYQAYWYLWWMVILFRSLLAFSFAFWICFLISLPERWLLIRVLSPFSYVGKVSYGIYLWHMLVIFFVIKLGMAHPSWKAAVLVVLLTLAISSFTWHFFEQPLIRKYHDKPRRGTA